MKTTKVFEAIIQQFYVDFVSLKCAIKNNTFHDKLFVI